MDDEREVKRWPFTGQRVFKESQASWSDTAILSSWQDQREHDLQIGYQEAAYAIYEAMALSSRDASDRMIFPLVVCWRHAVELHLKHLFVMCRQYRREDPTVALRHNLIELWRDVTPTLEECMGDFGPDAKAVDAMLQEIHRIDKGSTAFRYAKKADGSTNLTNIQTIDVPNLHRAMENLVTYLDACMTGMDHAIDVQCEIAQYYQGP